MTSETQVVLDTNVFISAIFFAESVPRQVMDYVTTRQQILMSSATIAELEDVLNRPKFNKFLPLEKRTAYLLKIIDLANIIEVQEVNTDCRDPKDNKFLEVAVSGNANYIISGDSDLLLLHPYRGIEIITPHAFLEMVQRGHSNQ
jgi:putative PIN family toxin of toxin-antitoxin system